MNWQRTLIIGFLILLFGMCSTFAQEKNANNPTKQQVETILDKIIAAKSDEDRKLAEQELRKLGDKATPHLQSIIVRGTLAQAMLKLVKEKQLPAFESKTLRIQAQLFVHAAGNGSKGKIPANFQLQLQLENLTEEKITLSKPTIASKEGDFQIGRWYEEKSKGQEWDGVLPAKEKKVINVIGEAPDKVVGEQELIAKITLDSMNFELSTIVKKGLFVRCPCGCDRSEQMIAELRKQEKRVALQIMEKSLESISEREKWHFVTEQMITHRLRLLALAEELNNQNQSR